MSKTRDQLIRIASDVINNLIKDNIEAALIWGSYSEGRVLSESSDIDLLVIMKRLDLIDDPKYTIIYGVPTLSINHEGSQVDIIFVDIPYIIKALDQKHWTIINALKNGIVICGEEVIVQLRSLLTDYRAFSLDTSAEWLNQATNILEKAQSMLNNDDYLSSIILVRHALDAMMHALIVSKLSRPPSPRSFLQDLRKAVNSEDVYNLYLQIQGIQHMNKSDAIKSNLNAIEILDYISSRIQCN